MDIHLKQKHQPSVTAIPGEVKASEDSRLWMMTLALLLFVIYKIPFLSLPFYWDEAWSYATAVFHLNEHGLFNPHPDLMRGHPPLFYILSALWVKFTGTTPVAVHILPLIIASALLWVLYHFTREFFNNTAALSAVVLFGLQSAFLSQSGMLLPEVLISLLAIASLYYYISGKAFLFAVAGSLMVMTKESGIIIILAIYLADFINKRLSTSNPAEAGREENNSRNDKGKVNPPGCFIRELIYLIPVLSFLIFMFVNKIKWGWYLYPDHTAMISFNTAQLLDKTKAYYSAVLLQNGRNIFLMAIVVAALIRPGIFKNRMVAMITLYFIILTVLFGIFSALNFFTSRYQLTVLPLYFITGSVIICSALALMLSKKPVMPAVKNSNKGSSVYASDFMFGIVTIILAGVFAYNTFLKMRHESDISVYYKDTVELHRDVVEYVSEGGWYDKNVYTAFLMQYNLAHPQMGYLKKGEHPFISVSNIHGLPYDLLIFCSNENDPVRDTVAANNKYELVKRFEKNNAWAEIYKPATR